MEKQHLGSTVNCFSVGSEATLFASGWGIGCSWGSNPTANEALRKSGEISKNLPVPRVDMEILQGRTIFMHRPNLVSACRSWSKSCATILANWSASVECQRTFKVLARRASDCPWLSISVRLQLVLLTRPIPATFTAWQRRKSLSMWPGHPACSMVFASAFVLFSVMSAFVAKQARGMPCHSHRMT